MGAAPNGAAGRAADAVVRGYEDQLLRHLADAANEERAPYDRLVSARRCAEAICLAVLGKAEGSQDLQALVDEIMREKLGTREVRDDLLAIRLRGNYGAHVWSTVPPDYREEWNKCAPCLKHVVDWFYADHLARARPLAVTRAVTSIRPGRWARRLQWALFGVVAMGTGALLVQLIANRPVRASGAVASVRHSNTKRPPASKAKVVVGAAHPEPSRGGADRGTTRPSRPSLLRDPRFVELDAGDGVGAFSIQDTEATVEQYRACVAVGACAGGAADARELSSDALPGLCTGGPSGRPLQPINCIDAAEADRLCEWLGKEFVRPPRPGRLPTATEWERAASWADTRARYWAKRASDRLPNLCDRAFLEAHPADSFCRTGNAGAENRDGHVGPADVATTEPPNGMGLFDILGNVAEIARTPEGFARMGRGFRAAVTSRGPLLYPAAAAGRLAHGGVRCATSP